MYHNLHTAIHLVFDRTDRGCGYNITMHAIDLQFMQM